MSRRILIVEPDPPGRAMMDRVLTSEGYTAEEYESAYHAKLLLDDGAFDLAVVDEFGGSGPVLSEVRFLRERYPLLPLIVTGTMLSASVLLDVVRLGVADAVPKPFTPAELRDAVARVFGRRIARRDEALEYDAALALARGQLASAHADDAASALRRVHAIAPLDAEGMALEALRCEVLGRDGDASRAYRAALALRHDEGTPPPDPYEGLARLGAYGNATPVAGLSATFEHAPIWLVSNPASELAHEPPDGVDPPYVIATALAIGSSGSGGIYFRENPTRAFALLTTDLRVERIAPLIARVGKGRLVATDEAAAALDLARLDELRGGTRGQTDSVESRPSRRVRASDR